MVRNPTVRPAGRLFKEKKTSVDFQGHAPCKLLAPGCFIASSLVIESKVSAHQDISRIKRCGRQEKYWKKKIHDWAVGKYSAATHHFNCFFLGRCWLRFVWPRNPYFKNAEHIRDAWLSRCVSLERNNAFAMQKEDDKNNNAAIY